MKTSRDVALVESFMFPKDWKLVQTLEKTTSHNELVIESLRMSLLR